MINYPAWLQSVHHDGSGLYVSQLYPRLGESVRLRLRVGADAPLRAVYLRTFPDGEQAFQPMTLGERNSVAHWWEISLPLAEPVVNYRFAIEADDGMWWYNAAGPAAHHPTDANDFRILVNYDAPSWLAERVFYQIFPDRFANANPGNDPQAEGEHGPRTFAWEEVPPEGFSFGKTFYGGDLQGIAQHLDYLQDLGVNALYLNPIFSAHTNHRYDVVDYEHVDPNLGGDRALIELRQALDARGMRCILDVVPNHCGYGHDWFQRARADATSPEVDFFTFYEHPDDYSNWLGFGSLPKLNYQNETLRGRMYRDDDAIFRHWLREPFSMDGWRVDVGNMLGRQGSVQLGVEVVRGIRQAVKETRSEAYLMSEYFHDATPYLQGDQWDGVMNYLGLTLPLWHWMTGLSLGALGFAGSITSPVAWPSQALAATWKGIRAAIPWSIALQQFNVLDSHDVPRIRTVVKENDALHRLAVVVQMTYPGVPCVYYGDEIGMQNHPSRLGQRACMIWDESRWDHSLRDFYRDLIDLRRNSAVFQYGGFQMLAIEAHTLAYQREAPEGRFIVVAHRDAQPRPAGPLVVAHGGIADGTRFVERFSGVEALVQGGVLALPEQPQGATLWEQII